MTKNYILAIATLMGTIIGVGIFTLPFVISQAGIISLLIYFPLLTYLQYILHLHFAEIILSTREKHRLPGYAEKYFGQSGRTAAFITEALGGYGSIIAYIIVGGIFLHQLLNPFLGGSLLLYTTILFMFEAGAVWFGLRLIANLEFIFTLLLVTVIGLIIFKGYNFINPDNYQLINLKHIFLPYGPVFFAVGGGAAIPEICRLLNNEKRKIKSAIAWGTFIPALMMMIFAITIIGITGLNTTADALSGLKIIFSGSMITLALLVGLFAIFTSFIVIAQALKEVYIWDLKINRTLAWFLACLIPYLLFLLGWNNLIKVVGFTGAVTGGLSGIILIWLLFKVKVKPDIKSPVKNKLTRIKACFLSLLFILGLIYEIWNLTH